MKPKGITTRLLHTPFPTADPHGSLNFPVYDSVAFEADTAEELEAAFQGREQRHLYSRITNPTVEYYQAKVQAMTGAFGVLALSSGMAAVSNLLLALGRSGNNFITSRHLFGNTLSLFEKTLRPFGLEARFTDLTNPEKVRELVDSNTIAIFLETITNPQLEVADIRSLGRIAGEHGLVLITDTTMTPPVRFDANKMGVNFEVMSTTKFISGGATSVGGLLIDYGQFDWSSFEKTRPMTGEHGENAFQVILQKQVFRNMGACLSPHNAFLQTMGLDTLALRVERSTSSALELAGRLEKRPEVVNVHYPGLKSSPFHDLACEQFGPKPCSLFTLNMGSKEECFRFMNRLKIARRSTNLQDNKTLIIHPASTIFAEYSHKEKKAMGLRDTMIRVSVGIEEIEDLIGDFDQALSE